MENKERTAGTENHIGIRQEERTYLPQQPPCLLLWQCREAPYFHPTADDPQLLFFFCFWPNYHFFIILIYQKGQNQTCKRTYLIVGKRKKKGISKFGLAPIVAGRLAYYEDNYLTSPPLPHLPPLALLLLHPSPLPFLIPPVSAPATHSGRKSSKRQLVLQDGTFAHHLKMVHGAPKDPDGHVVIHMHDPSFQRGSMPLCDSRRFFTI